MPTKTNAVVIAEIQLTLHEMEKDIADIKQCLKTEYQTKESAIATKDASMKLAVDLEKRVSCLENTLDIRIGKIEGSLSKITWAIIMAVLSAVLSLVIKSV